MVTVTIVVDNVVFEVAGPDRAFTERSRLQIPIAHITAARVDPEPATTWFKGFRMAGADVPHMLRAGLLYEDARVAFWDIRHPDRTIVVDLRDERYETLVIEVADPAAAVAAINSAIASGR